MMSATFKKLQKELCVEKTQKLLYLQLLHNIIQNYPEQPLSFASPTSPYFFDGKRVPMKHASLILRMLKNKRVPIIRLKPKSANELVEFLEQLWNQAANIAQAEMHQELKMAAFSFIQVGLELNKLSRKKQNFEPTLFDAPSETGLTHLFEAAWQFGIEYYTFSLERI